MPDFKLHKISAPWRTLLAAALLALLASGLAPAASAGPLIPDPDDFVSAPSSSEDQSAPARSVILRYTAREGDSLWSIAAEFGLDVDTLRWSNPELAQNPDYLRPGQELIILPLPGAYVTVGAGDTLERLAERWGVAPADIASYPLNRLGQGEEPRPGARLVIPYGRREVVLTPPGPAAGYTYAWPIRGTVTQRYSASHRAVDLGAPYGAKVFASRAGRCIAAVWSTVGYGYLVVVDHGDGSQAYYSHLKGAWVQPGDWVPRGALVGEVGSTGNSTGPHVHFEIRIGGVPQNPLALLPPKP